MATKRTTKQSSSLASSMAETRSKPTQRQSTSNPPHLVVQALAGTGKTTTLVEGLKLLRGIGTTLTPSPQQKAVWGSICLSTDARFVCFCAFNRSIKKELEQRVPQGCDAKTMNGLGYGAVRKAFPNVQLNQDRVDALLARILGMDVKEMRWRKKEIIGPVRQLVNLCKMNLLNVALVTESSLRDRIERRLDDRVADALDQLTSYYDIELNGNREAVYDLVPQVLAKCKRPDLDGEVDFADQVWLPVVLGLPVFRYDLLLVDEAQDLNRCQQELAKMAGKRLIFCGDPHQAIYGFAGADAESMARLVKELGETPAGCVTLPLTVTRRCGKAIVEEAKQYVPEYEAHESNPDGKVDKLPFKHLRSKGQAGPGTGPVLDQEYRFHVVDGDMILARTNAILVSECFKFIKKGQKATIQGRDIGVGLASTVKKLKASDTLDLRSKLERWEEEQVQKENNKKHPSDARIQAIQDRVDCLGCFIDQVEADALAKSTEDEHVKATIEDVLAKINAIFTDNDTSGIKLSSIHKAKGLEASRVFFLRTKDCPCPHPMAKTKWAREQERNLCYVAITRAIDTLYHVND